MSRLTHLLSLKVGLSFISGIVYVKPAFWHSGKSLGGNKP